MTSQHRHGAKGNLALAGDVDARLAALEARVALLEKPPVAPPPVTPAPPPGVPAFLSRPVVSAINRSGGSDVLIENVTIRSGTIGIYVYGVNGTITIRDVDLADLVGGIFLQQCSGTLVIERVRSRNIGDGTIGSGHSNHVQLNNCRFEGGIRDSKFLGGRTEDMLSIFQSGGHGVGRELVIERNALQGLVADTATVKAWTSGSGTGIIVGDGPGSYMNGHTIVRTNTLLTPGQVGIQHIDGPYLQTYDNVIYGEKRPLNNNPMTSWEGNPSGSVRNNRYWWTNEDGSHPDPWFAGYGSLLATGNIEDSTLDPATLRVVL